jgi:hypothetical protein
MNSLKVNNKPSKKYKVKNERKGGKEGTVTATG